MRMFEDEQPTLLCKLFSILKYALWCIRLIFNFLVDKSFLFSQYCTLTGRYVNELIDCGSIADAEQRFVVYFKFTLFACIPYRSVDLFYIIYINCFRLLSAVNSFYFIRRLITFKSENTEHVGEWLQALCSVSFIPVFKKLNYFLDWIRLDVATGTSLLKSTHQQLCTAQIRRVFENENFYVYQPVWTARCCKVVWKQER